MCSVDSRQTGLFCAFDVLHVDGQDRSLYEPRERSGDCLKLKLENQQEFVIGVYRPDGESNVDALLVGYYECTKLRFAGKVRAGLVLHARRKLAPLRLPQWPFSDLPTGKPRWAAV